MAVTQLRPVGKKQSRARNWNIPATGGYIGGYRTGEALALTLLKSMRHDDLQIGQLAGVVQSMMIRFEEEGGSKVRRSPNLDDAMSSLGGQCDGFFHCIAKWAAAGVRTSGAGLDRINGLGLAAQAVASIELDHTLQQARA